jgi:serine/threonine protein kinase
MRSYVVAMTLMHHHQSGAPDVYSRHEELGHGGFAAVYRVTNQSGESFALKAISRVRVLKPKALEKLKSEIAIQRSLDHPNVVKSFSSFQDRANHYILLELCPGHSARDRLRSVGHVREHWKCSGSFGTSLPGCATCTTITSSIGT